MDFEWDRVPCRVDIESLAASEFDIIFTSLTISIDLVVHTA